MYAVWMLSRTIGTVIDSVVRNRPAPSTRAASKISAGMPLIAAMNSTM